MSTTPPAAQPSFPIEAIAVFPAPGMAMPNSFAFTNDDRLLLYLMGDKDQPQQLFALDVQTGVQRVLIAPPGGGTKEANLSPEEELRRQRERMLAVGITHFALARQGERILLPMQGNILVHDGPDAPLRTVVDTAGQPPALNAAFAPDGSQIAYVQDAEILVIAAEGGVPRQITQGARGTGKTHGLAEYIAQEELARSEGFWWSRDGQHIAFAEVDETGIPEYRIMHQGKEYTGPSAQEDHRYPFAGEANAVVKLAVVPAQGGAPVWMDLAYDEEIYLARVFWWPDGALGAQILNRTQTMLDLVRFNNTTGARASVLIERNEAWVNLRRKHFTRLDDGTFLWASEHSGYNHLYLYAGDGGLIRQLTTGTWMVDSIAGVDEQQGIVYFTGNREHPTEAQLYAVPLAGGDVRRVTTQAGTHAVTLDHGTERFVDMFSSLEQPPVVTLRSLADDTVLQPIQTPTDPRIQEYHLRPPAIVTLQNRQGDTLYGAVYRPPLQFGPGPYPTIVQVYGGPGPQTVTDSWALTAALQLQYLRELGFLVFRLDNRGSARRGLAFERAIKHRMGTIEVEDQVDGVRWLASQGLTDLSRVGVTGWSYGGYMTLMCLAKAPEVFKVGVAGAPVTSWDGYDTCYTERYMGTPESNPDGYASGDVMRAVQHLRGKLLLVHGMLDENVHFRHTARLINALIRARKPYDLLAFPDERHMPRREQDRVYLNERVVGYFRDNL